MPSAWESFRPPYTNNVATRRGPLQVLKSDSQWAWTNGRLRSVVHRAVVNKEKQSLSVAYFLSPRSSAMIDSPPSLIDSSTNPRKYVSFTWGDLGRSSCYKRGLWVKLAIRRVEATYTALEVTRAKTFNKCG